MKEITFKERVKQGINDLFYIWLREFRTTFRDQGVLIFFILVPVVYPLSTDLSIQMRWYVKFPPL